MFFIRNFEFGRRRKIRAVRVFRPANIEMTPTAILIKHDEFPLRWPEATQWERVFFFFSRPRVITRISSAEKLQQCVGEKKYFTFFFDSVFHRRTRRRAAFRERAAAQTRYHNRNAPPRAVRKYYPPVIITVVFIQLALKGLNFADTVVITG